MCTDLKSKLRFTFLLVNHLKVNCVGRASTQAIQEAQTEEWSNDGGGGGGQ
jgi:hypothetical protein